MLLLVGEALDDYRSARETRHRTVRRDIGRTVRVSLLGTGKSVANPGGHDTPPRNAAQFKGHYVDYIWEGTGFSVNSGM